MRHWNGRYKRYVLLHDAGSSHVHPVSEPTNSHATITPLPNDLYFLGRMLLHDERTGNYCSFITQGGKHAHGKLASY